MSHVEGTNTLNVPPAQVRTALEDIEHAPEWVASLQKVWDIQGKGQGCKYKWTFKMRGMPVDGSTEIIESNDSVFIMSTTGGIPSTWTWTMKPAGSGTELTLKIDYTVPGSFLGAIADRLVIEGENQKELQASLSNLKARLEK